MCRLLLALMIASGVCASNQPSASNAAPPIPFEDHGVCPGEGCVYREWTARKPVTFRGARSAKAPIAFTVRIGEKVTALTGVVVTTRPGQVKFREPTTLSTSLGEMPVVPEDTLYLLTYLGEGETKGWLRGRLMTLDGFAFMATICDEEPLKCKGRIVSPTQSEWWVQARNSRGQTGWVLGADQFDGTSHLGR